MDLKGKSWVGSIYHQFEAICQEVDDFVSKDTVKYVENQVQSVGVSVKRLYSDVVRDILPPLGDDIKPKTQSVTGKQDDTRDHVKSVISKMTSPNCGDEKQLSVEQGSSDILNKCNTSWSRDLDLVMCCTKPHSADSSQEAKTDVSLKQDGDTMILNDSGKDVEEKIAKVTIPITANSSSEKKALSVTSDEDQNNTTLAMASSPALSVHDPELLTFKPQGILCHGISNDVERFSNISSSGWLSEGELPLVQDINLDEDGSFSEPPEASAEKAPQHITLGMDSSTSLARDSAHRASGKDWTLYDRFSTKDQCVMVSNTVQSPEPVFSYFSCDDEEVEKSVISSSCSTSSESLNLLESTSANFTQTDENTCNTHVESNDCVCNISNDHTCAPSFATSAYEVKGVDILPALSILESNDCDTSTTHGSVSVGGSSESRHAQCYKEAQSTFLIPSSESGNSNIGVGIGDLNMETIDLSTNVNCNVLNGNFRATSHRRKNFRYYKKLIQDAFASRKRYSKEYEHLAIWYGDIDSESKQHFAPSSLPPSPTTSAPAARSLSFHKTCDSGWELL